MIRSLFCMIFNDGIMTNNDPIIIFHDFFNDEIMKNNDPIIIFHDF